MPRHTTPSALHHVWGVQTKRPNDIVQSLERGIAVLTAFDADHRTMTLTEVARRCQLPRSAARRFLHTLAELGYVTTTGRAFRLTPQVLELGYSHQSTFTLADVCQPHIEQLAHSLGRSVYVSLLDGTDVRYVSRATLPGSMTVLLRPGTRIPAHLTAAGRVLLSTLDQKALAEYLAESSRNAGSGALTGTQREQLHRELVTIRRQGWAFADQLLDAGLRDIAVPLRNRDGEIVAALSAYVYESQIADKGLVAQLLPRLLESAGSLSLELRSGAGG
ncbi:IclR family transcriptional regulator domain-containing protein [Rhodococcus marinonascens]|uniref:IclR family transcriptional regulator domain-containing protein n=1 Tax=Rhodococcus marinonascens TaxID=38311 RepID=UPI000932457E|nr:IclR family transcriptional regulator C-terminal domain-containing protein [Rhodococcus marinonascens]